MTRPPRGESEGDEAAGAADASEIPQEAAELSAEAVVELPFEDVLDLHGFPPRDVREIILGYLGDADAAGFSAVRIVHGRGMGVQREAVRALLARDERVIEFSDAPESQGGRGATLVRLRRGSAFS
ncbi:MAG: Smr/MutS family protein [Thermoanaerobaculia bacterium]